VSNLILRIVVVVWVSLLLNGGIGFRDVFGSMTLLGSQSNKIDDSVQWGVVVSTSVL
jgi:hypothetical protein